jgi:5-aminopentanamidase
MRELMVAAVQATPTPGDVAANAGLGAGLVAQAQGARVVVLPELFLSAYHPPTLYAEPDQSHVAASADATVDDPRLDPLREAARAIAAIIVVGAAVRHMDGRRTCSALVVSHDGSIVVGYDKETLWGPDERALFTPGDRGTTLSVDGWRLGLGICYDGCFPEHGRAAAEDGAHACLYPSGYLAGSSHRRDIYYAARALDNTMYVAFANSVGEVSPIPRLLATAGLAGARSSRSRYVFNGGAAVYDPEGRVLVRAPDEGEAVVVATLDPNELARVRRTHTMLDDLPRGASGQRHQLLVN